MKSLFSDKRFLILLLLMVVVAYLFWTSSRYPALDTKAMMAGALNMQDGLSFDAWLKHSADESWLERTGITFLNWIHTNRQGMTFGLLFAVLAMSIVPLIQRHIYFRPNGWNASFIGFMFGAPLGVCVNCAAPIAFGMYKSGARAELAIAAMISSPTFNLVVVSMLITLFAWPLVFIKLGITLLVIFLLVPLLLRLFDNELYSSGRATVADSALAPPIADASDSLSVSHWVIQTLWRNSRYLLIKVLPIMLLAGLLGTIVVSLAPWERLSEFSGISGYAGILATMLVLSFLGLLLPVPIAFDIIISATLIAAGIPIKYVAVLLFTLGTFSVYSFMILWKAGARKVATSLYACLVVCGVIAGLASEFADEKYREWEVANLYNQLRGDDAKRQIIPPLVIGDSTIAAASALTYSVTNLPMVEALPLNPDTMASNSNQWSMNLLANDGFLLHERPLIERITESFSRATSIAAGDVNNDNWIDILVGSSQGLYLYMNTGGRFEPTKLPFQSTFNNIVGANGLQDFDNDGALDIYFTIVNQGSYISYNLGGNFLEPQRLSSPPAFINSAVAFGDIDHNGELDIVEGRHSGLAYMHRSGDKSRNVKLMQKNGRFTSEVLSGHPGETLAMLLSDLNDDGWLDLLVGNDFDEPDVYYWGAENGTFVQWNDDSVVTTESSMSIDSADIDNDLRMETYHAQITRNPASPPTVIPEFSLVDLHADMCSGNDSVDAETERRCANMVVRQVASFNRGVSGCQELPENLKFDCMAGRWFISGRLGTQPLDRTILDRWYPEYADIYSDIYANENRRMDAEIGLAQMLDTNMLYRYTQLDEEIAIEEQAEELGIDITGWTWNAKFADLDGDQWQDLYAVNGFRGFVTDTSNVWFRNLSGSGFSEETVSSGLIDYEPTNSSVYVDIDNDGDLDLINYAPSGKLKTYINSGSGNNHLQIELNDAIGNRRGIGSTVTIHYADGLHQRREIKASGGFYSQDPSIAHFGLSDSQLISRIEVRWSTGELTEYNGPFSTQNRYRINRQ